MSDIQKCPNLIQGGEGQQFSKMSEIRKSLKFPIEGGGGQAYLGIFPKFFLFFLWLPLGKAS